MNRSVRDCTAILLCGLLLGLFGWQNVAHAQVIRRPADEAPPTPEPGLEPAPETTMDGLPELPPDLGEGAILLARVRTIEVRGVTAFSDERIAEITRPFVDRFLSTSDLAQLTRALTALYADNGYLTSTTVLPDQDLEGGRLVLQVVEGEIGTIRVEGNENLRHAYLASRIRAATGRPLQINHLTTQLAILQQNRWIERVDAVLEPTSVLGRSDLLLRVRERSPWSLSAFAANDLSSSVGSLNGGFNAKHGNLVGIDDELGLFARFSEGVRQVEVSGRVPINRWDTELRAVYQYTTSSVVTPGLDDLDIVSKSHFAELELSHPVLRTRAQALRLGAVVSWNQSKSELLGGTFCFQLSVSDCRPTVNALRLRGDYTLRTRRTSLSIRSTLSFGLDLPWTTSSRNGALPAGVGSSEDLPDGEFVTWLGQVRWLQRLPLGEGAPNWLRGILLSFRADVQISNERLLPSEQIAVGGPDTVRGYRRNALVRDNAMIGSVELRVPVWRDAFSNPVVEVAPFFDVGRATNANVVLSSVADRKIRTISSVGLALRLDLPRGVQAEMSWAHRIRQGIDSGTDLQRHGVYFRLVWNAF